MKDIADVWATSILYVPPVPFLDAVNREIHAVATDAHTMAVAAKAAADSARSATMELRDSGTQCWTIGEFGLHYEIPGLARNQICFVEYEYFL